jgi:AICAR transformylase/IMP cyclohydrolase PurH
MVLATLNAKGSVPEEMRVRLAIKGFKMTAHYDTVIADYLASKHAF